MTDPHPANFEIEIDRERLRKYLRAKWLLLWLALLGFFGALFGLAAASGRINQANMMSSNQIAVLLVKGPAVGLAVGAGAAGLCYLLFSHRLAGRIASSLGVSVEGPFIRIRQSAESRTDRKLHFRSIVDYSCVQGRLRCLLGIESLHLTTSAGGQHSFLVIHAVKDCLRVRDLLAEIDSLRENG